MFIVCVCVCVRYDMCVWQILWGNAFSVNWKLHSSWISGNIRLNVFPYLCGCVLICEMIWFCMFSKNQLSTARLRMYVHTYTHIHIHICICAYIFLAFLMYIYIYMMSMCLYVYIHMCNNWYLCVYVYIHICICTHIYIRMTILDKEYVLMSMLGKVKWKLHSSSIFRR